jgi:ribose-phosphate pyrophosphokinase
MRVDEIKVFCGTAVPGLSKEICAFLDVPLGDAIVSQFNDGEIKVQLNENVRGNDVFLINSTAPPVNHNLMELLILIDAARRASARRITAVIPYYGYARQDKKDKPRVPLTAKLVANLITAAGADRVLTLDLHAGQIQAFFDIPVDHLYAAPVLVDFFKKQEFDNLSVVAPDTGGVTRARAFARRLDADLVIIDKRRPSPNEAEIMNVVGNIRGRHALIVDDIVDTAGTLVKAAQALLDHGARAISASCTHPVLSGDAVERIDDSPLDEMVVCNTIPIDKRKKSKKIKVLSVAALLGEAIRRIHNEDSVSSLFV